MKLYNPIYIGLDGATEWNGGVFDCFDKAKLVLENKRNKSKDKFGYDIDEYILNEEKL